MSEEIVSETLREVGPSAAGGGSYQIISPLKEGRLYLAQREGKRFILKVPASGGVRDLELLRREWELSTGLSHPGLAYVFTWEESSPVGPCIVQEYVDGRPLSTFLSEKPSAAARKRVFRQLLQAVAYLHGKGVIHNDLSPVNILVTNADDDVKLIDLGFADDDTHFLMKSLGGTRGYASPELLRGERTDARSDVYSLGLILRDLFPRRYGRVVRRCLMMAPGDRYSSADALLKACDRYYYPFRAAAAFCAVAAVLLGFWAIDYRAGMQRRSDAMLVDSLRNSLGSMTHTVDSLTEVLEAEHAERDSRQKLLGDAKAAVDDWYAREVPAFRRALKRAGGHPAVTAAWSALMDKYLKLNSDIPAMVPEDLRGTVRDYLFQKYNDVFPALQSDMAARLNELGVN